MWQTVCRTCASLSHSLSVFRAQLLHVRLHGVWNTSPGVHYPLRLHYRQKGRYILELKSAIIIMPAWLWNFLFTGGNLHELNEALVFVQQSVYLCSRGFIWLSTHPHTHTHREDDRPLVSQWRLVHRTRMEWTTSGSPTEPYPLPVRPYNYPQSLFTT